MSVQQETRFPPLQVSEKQDRRFSSGNPRVNGQSEKWVLLQPITVPRGSALMKQLRAVSTPGCLSTWPAHVTSQILQQRQKNLSLGLNHGFAKEVSGVRGKPQFLQMLERYLRLELQALSPHQPKAQEHRLQVYREVFDCFIEDLKTYKPLLSAIKNEYEVTLAHLQDQIRELEPLRAQLVIVSEQCEQRVLALREQERSEVNVLKQEAQCLQKIIDEMREQQDILQTQVRVLQRDLADQYLAYRQEHDARRLLISSTGNAGHRPGEVQVKQGSTILCATQVERLRAEYVDMVPRRDWQALHCAHQESQLRDLQAQKQRWRFQVQNTNPDQDFVSTNQLQTLQTDFDQLRAEYDTLLEVHGQVAPQRGHLQTEPKMLQDVAVPRPHREEGTDLLLVNRSSQQLTGILLEKQGQRTTNPDTEAFFTDLDTADSVPVHLPFKGKLKNLKLDLPDLVNILQVVWKAKATADEEREERIKLLEFLRWYLEGRYGEQAGDWAYSLVEACWRHRENHFVSLFYDILTGKVDESVYHRQTSILSHLLKEFVNIDTTKSGTLTSREFSESLQRALPLKGEDDIKELVKAAQSEMDDSEDVISYQTLCAEHSDRPHRDFLHVLMKQEDTQR